VAEGEGVKFGPNSVTYFLNGPKRSSMIMNVMAAFVIVYSLTDVHICLLVI